MLLVSPQAGGHHVALYLRDILLAAHRRPWQIHILTTSEALAHPSFGQLLDDLARRDAHPEVHVALPLAKWQWLAGRGLVSGQLLTYLRLASAFRSAQASHRFDVVYTVSLDGFDKAMSVLGSPFGSIPTAGMLTRLNFFHVLSQRDVTLRARARALIIKLLLLMTLHRGSIAAITVVDHKFHASISASRYDPYSKIRLLREAGTVTYYPQSIARATLGIGAQRLVILLYGSLSRRKGGEQLMTGIADCADRRILILLAGKCDEDVQALLRSPLAKRLSDEGRLLARPHFHDRNEEGLLFAAADFVWLGYTGAYTGSSGVLHQAISAQRPVLATSTGIIGEVVDRHRLGLLFDPDCQSSVRAAIDELLTMGTTTRADFMDRVRAYSESAGPPEFGEAVCKLIEEIGQ